jgi:ferredoxin
MKTIRKIIEIDEELCDGCGQCVPGCAEGALQIIDGKARLVEDKYCDGLGACIGECPTGALKVIEREAEEFDEEAVEAYLSDTEKTEESVMACGCPSSHIQQFVPSQSCESANAPATIHSSEGSALSHWPVQIRLIPSNAPFLKHADLLVVADCVPIAFPTFHRDWLEAKTVMMGCPKFDDVQLYIDKFAEIFNTAEIRSITVAVMEVPCCSGLPMIVKKGMQAADKDIPIKEIVIKTKGEILKTS